MAELHLGGTVPGTGPEAPTDSTNGSDEHLPTTKLPPLPAPPLAVRRSNSPPGSIASSKGDSGESSQADGPTTWWQAILTSIGLRRGAGGSKREADAQVVERCAGAVCGAFGLALFFLALGVGLRSAPVEVSGQPLVAAATVLARAAVACGMLAFGFGLVRIGERLLVSRGSSSDRMTSSGGRSFR